MLVKIPLYSCMHPHNHLNQIVRGVCMVQKQKEIGEEFASCSEVSAEVVEFYRHLSSDKR